MRLQTLAWAIIASTLAGELHGGIIPVELKHVYYPHPEDPNTTGGEVGISAVDETTGEIYPYSTVVFNFFVNLDESQRDFFQDNVRVTKQTPEGDIELQHLHEALDEVDQNFGVVPPANMDEEGPHASFFWTTRDGSADGFSQLRYSPFGLDGGSTYTAVLPSFFCFTAESNATFTTKTFTGNDARVYEAVVPDLAGWRIISEKAQAQSKEEIPCYFFDRFSPDPRDSYFGTSIRIRGNTSLGQPQKRYNVEFSRSFQFRGFKDEGGFQGERRRIILQAGLSTVGGVVETLFSNKVGFHVMRELEKRVYGAALSPDSYFAHLVLNGHYWGVYLTVEHISTGNGGLTDTADRSAAGFLRGAILHKAGEEQMLESSSSSSSSTATPRRPGARTSSSRRP